MLNTIVEMIIDIGMALVMCGLLYAFMTDNIIAMIGLPVIMLFIILIDIYYNKIKED